MADAEEEPEEDAETVAVCAMVRNLATKYRQLCRRYLPQAKLVPGDCRDKPLFCCNAATLAVAFVACIPRYRGKRLRLLCSMTGHALRLAALQAEDADELRQIARLLLHRMCSCGGLFYQRGILLRHHVHLGHSAVDLFNA